MGDSILSRKVKVSICIPTYNSGKTLLRLLDSIHNQKFKNYEVCISDNSEDDVIENIVKQFSTSLIKYEHNKSNIGATKNWNKAICMASGEYIKVMFSDDWFTDENSLGEFVKLLDTCTEVNFAFSGSVQVSLNSNYRRNINNKKAILIKKDYRNLFLGNYIGAPSATIWRNEGYLFGEKYKWLVDMELYIRMLKNKNEYIYTESPLVSIGIGDQQLTNEFIVNKELSKKEYIDIFETYRLVEVKACRIYMAEILIRSRIGPKVAIKMGILFKEYLEGLVRYFWSCVKGKLIK